MSKFYKTSFLCVIVICLALSNMLSLAQENTAEVENDVLGVTATLTTAADSPPPLETSTPFDNNETIIATSAVVDTELTDEPTPSVEEETLETEAPGVPPLIETVVPVSIEASFEYTILNDNSVQFTDTSTVSSGSIEGRVWNFGDGDYSTEANPTHEYFPGIYRVSLVVRSGEIYQEVAREITVIVPLIASFDTKTTDTYLLVQFSSTSQGNIDTYLWNFGDGTSNTEVNPLHQFTSDGIYQISLTVSGPEGTSNTTGELTVGNVSDETLTISFRANPDSGYAPLIVEFVANVPAAASVAWDFGDGQSDVGQSITHTFNDPGIYTVTATASYMGKTASTTGVITVLSRPESPHARFSVDPQTGHAPLDATFTNASIGDITNWEYMLPDGTTYTTKDASHRFTEPGAYVVILTVYGLGGVDQTSQTIYVTPPSVAPIADFLYMLHPPYNSLTVVFDSALSQNAANYNWDFGDASFSNEINPTHIFPAEGIYTVTLTVTSVSGDTSTALRSVSVFQVDGPTALFEVFDEIPDYTSFDEDPLAFQFHNTSWPGTAAIADYDWDFGDGSQSTERDPAHRFTSPGTYNVTLRVRDTNGLESRYVLPVTAKPLYIEIQCPNSIVNLGDEVLFLARSWGTSPTGFFWDYGDGTTGEGEVTQHIYDQTGSHQVMVTVVDTQNQSMKAFCRVYVLSPNEVVAYFESSSGGVAPVTRTFTNKSIGEVVRQVWDFGDGATSTERDPQPHIYSNPGSYTITLTVYGQDGQESTYSRTTQVYIPLLADFTASPEIGIAPAKYTFVAITNQPVSSIIWDLGDGITRYGERVSTVYFQPGDYEVTMTVKSPAGNITVTKTIRVYPTGNIHVALRPDRSWAITPLTEICFTNMSTGDISSYSWDFGDSSHSDSFQPCHTYNSAGNYIVALTAIGEDGAGRATTHVQIYDPSQGLIHIEYEQLTGNEVCFFTNEEGIATAWEWQLAAGVIHTGSNPCYTYPEPGHYQVELVITLTNGTKQYIISDVYVISQGTLVPASTLSGEEVLPSLLPPSFLTIETPTPFVWTPEENLVPSGTAVSSLPTPFSELVFQTNTPRWTPPPSVIFATPMPTIAQVTTVSSSLTPVIVGELESEEVEKTFLVGFPPPTVPIETILVGLTTMVVLVGTVVSQACVGGQIQGSGIGVNLRSGPGLGYGIITAYPDGTAFTACARCYADGYTWMRVQMSDGRTGWMASNWSTVDVGLLVDECPTDGNPPSQPPVVIPDTITIPPALCKDSEDERNQLLTALAAEQQAQARYNQMVADANYWHQLANQANQQAANHARQALNCASQIPAATVAAISASAQQALAAVNVTAAILSLGAAQLIEGAVWVAYQAVNWSLGWLAAQPWGGWAREQINNAYRSYEAARRSREWWEAELKHRQDDYTTKAEEAARKWEHLGSLTSCALNNAAQVALWLARAAYYWLRAAVGDASSGILWLLLQMAISGRTAAEKAFDTAQKECSPWAVAYPQPDAGFNFSPREKWDALPLKFHRNELQYNPKDNSSGYASYEELCQPGRGADTSKCPNKEDQGKGSEAQSLRDVLELIVIHHIGVTNYGELEGYRETRNAKNIPQLFQIWAQDNEETGYADIEYHYLIDPDGKVYEGRPINVRGRHVNCKNTGAVGILLLGDFDEMEGLNRDVDADDPNCPMIESTIKLIRWLKHTYSFKGGVVGHRELPYQSTECPGNKIMDTYLGPCEKYQGYKLIDIFKNA